MAEIAKAEFLSKTKHTQNNIYIDLIISTLIYPLTMRVVGAPQMIWQQFLPFFPVLHCPLGLANSRPLNSLMLSSHLFLYLPCFLPPYTVPCNMVLVRPDEREKKPFHCSLCLFTMVRSSCGPIACWILAHISSLVTWYGMRVSCGSTLLSRLEFLGGGGLCCEGP